MNIQRIAIGALMTGQTLLIVAALAGYIDWPWWVVIGPSLSVFIALATIIITLTLDDLIAHLINGKSS